MASKTKIYIVLEFGVGGELFDKIVRFPYPYNLYLIYLLVFESCIKYLDKCSQFLPLESFFISMMFNICVTSKLLQVHDGRLQEDAARKYFQQLINAVDYCHSRGVYHRDLKVPHTSFFGKFWVQVFESAS